MIAWIVMAIAIGSKSGADAQAPFKSPLTFKVSLQTRNESKVSGTVSITLKNSSHATGTLYATNIAMMTAAHGYYIQPKTEAEPSKPVVIDYAYNATSPGNNIMSSCSICLLPKLTINPRRKFCEWIHEVHLPLIHRQALQSFSMNRSSLGFSQEHILIGGPPSSSGSSNWCKRNCKL